MKRQSSLTLLKTHRRHLLLALIVAGSLALILSLPPIVQVPDYHDFADRRAFIGVPNFGNVASNVFFLFIGIAGLRFCLSNDLGRTRGAWMVLFAGVALVSVGSACYHWRPGNETLFWDRLPMTVAFMGLFVALLGEYVSEPLGRFLLVPALAVGLSSVFYGEWFNDLRFYAWVQLIPLLTIPVLMLLFPARHSHQWGLLVALGWYALAKVFEANDRAVFLVSQGLVSGHTLKHLLAALGCFTLLWMLQRRKPLHE